MEVNTLFDKVAIGTFQYKNISPFSKRTPFGRSSRDMRPQCNCGACGGIRSGGSERSWKHAHVASSMDGHCRSLSATSVQHFRLVDSPLGVLNDTTAPIGGACILSGAHARYIPRGCALQARDMVKFAREDLGPEDTAGSWVVTRHLSLQYGAEAVSCEPAGLAVTLFHDKLKMQVAGTHSVWGVCASVMKGQRMSVSSFTIRMVTEWVAACSCAAAQTQDAMEATEWFAKFSDSSQGDSCQAICCTASNGYHRRGGSDHCNAG